MSYGHPSEPFTNPSTLSGSAKIGGEIGNLTPWPIINLSQIDRRKGADVGVGRGSIVPFLRARGV
jgi:hypothetical protein